MAIFKKKNIEVKTNPEADIKVRILEKLNEKINGTLYDNAILIPRLGFTIDIQIVKNEVKDNLHILNVIFIVKNDYMREVDEPIIEPISSQGKDSKESIERLVVEFETMLWKPIQSAFSKGKALPVSSNYLGQHYDYDLYVNSVVILGDSQKKPAMLINYIKDALALFLGSKKYYWVRIFLARKGKKGTEDYKQNIEVRINGIICPSLAGRFQKYIDSWEDKDTIVVEKQYAIIVNKEEEDLCPFTKEQVVEYTRKTLPLLEECKSPEEEAEIKNKMGEFVHDAGLLAEIRIFIPEILAKLTIGYKEGDSLFLIDGESRIEFRKTQLRSYYYMQQVLIDYLSRTKPPKEKVHNIVYNSAAFREVRKYVGKENEKLGRNIKAEDLFIPGTTYKVNVENYKVW